MPPDSRVTVDQARSASSEELKALIHDVNEEALLALLENPNLTEQHVCRLLERVNLPAEVLSAVAQERRWSSSGAVRLRIARHPHAPRRTALAALRQLFVFDLVRVSLLPSAPAEIRRVAEEIMVTRISHLAVGEKLTLARRGPARVAGALLAEGHPQALKLALGNSFLTESQVLKVLAKPDVPARAVAAIAQHSKWSRQYNVCMALVRNSQTPVPAVLGFLPNLTLRGLKEIAKLESLAPHLKKYIQQELRRRTPASTGAE